MAAGHVPREAGRRGRDPGEPVPVHRVQGRVEARRWRGAGPRPVKKTPRGESMAGRGTGPDFVEALARGLDVLACFDADHRSMSLTEVATAAGLDRPTARRLLLTLEALGFVRSSGGAFQLTPKVLTLGMAYVGALGLWDIARPHLETLVARTGESSSMAQLDGSDIVYVARVSVPKLIALRGDIGTRFPAVQTSQGKVLLAALSPADLGGALAQAGAAEPGRTAAVHRALAGAAARRAHRGPRPRMGARRRGARAGRPLGRRPGAGRLGHGPGRDESDGARRGGPPRAADRRAPAPAAPDGRRRQRRMGAVAEPPARRD